jgi:hypothetical protein
MTRSLLTPKTVLAVLFGLVVGCAASQVAPQFVVPVARAGTNPTKWEYTCMDILDGITDTANKMGAQGWELTAASGYAVHYQGKISKPDEPRMVWCFKRALP